MTEAGLGAHPFYRFLPQEVDFENGLTGSAVRVASQLAGHHEPTALLIRITQPSFREQLTDHAKSVHLI